MSTSDTLDFGDTHLGGPPGPAPRRADEGGLRPGERVGRYVVLSRLGAGGMGVVYAAHDPELDRRVALKLVRAGASGSEERQRLLREAQAMAKLAHPNVVAIFDVGERAGEVFLAMELVDGETLRAWLERPHPWPEVLDALLDAGRGLAAAHAKGLVHRDFKPDNVMIDGDGRVRVMDFGLAREVVREPARPAPAPAAGDADTLLSDDTAAALTRTGALLGTPAYMAPEQFAGAETDARTDQFALCVTMWEALYGARPFAGGSTAALARAIQRGERRTPPKDVRLPRWLRAAIERGLAIDPADRWPSIDALLEALRRGQTRARRRRVGLALVVLAALIAGAFAWDAARRARARATCERAGAAIDEVWDDAARAEIRAGIEASGASYAAITADKVMPWIDRFAAAWTAARAEICVAAEISGDLDAALYARGERCLEGQVLELESLLAELARADERVVQRAVAAAAALSEVSSCRDPTRLARLPEPPTADEGRLRQLRADLSRASTLLIASKYEEGLKVAEAALVDAEALAWPPLVAEAQLALGALQSKLGRYDEAEATLEAAYFTAAAHQLAELEVNTAGQLTVVTGYALTRPADGERWARLAEVGLRRLGEDDPLLEAGRLNSLAMVRQAAGDFESSTRLFEAALGRAREALGGDHPKVAQMLNNLAVAQRSRGDFAAAEAINREVIATLEAGLGPEHPDFATAVNNLADTLAERGDRDEVIALYRRALTIRELALGPDHPHVAQTLIGLGATLRASGEHTQAELALSRGLAIFEAALGGEHPDVAYALTHLAEVELALGEVDRAAEHFTRSRDLFERTLGPDYHYLALPLVGLAEVALAREQATAAIAPAERALKLVADVGGAPKARADARFALARALWATDRDRARADELATAAKAEYRQLGAAGSDGLAALDRWLGDRDAPTGEGPR